MSEKVGPNLSQKPSTQGSASMKRFHIHIGVENLEQSIQFYSTLFGQQPSKHKSDYAKWMLDEPRLNFAISTRISQGVDHLGIQVDNDAELTTITERLRVADLGVTDANETTCCYAESKKAWVQDPSGIAWETYRTMADVEIFNSSSEAGDLAESSTSACCPSTEQEQGNAETPDTEQSNCC